MSFELARLPYPVDTLEPHMSAETLRLHHGRHQRQYVDTLNELVAGTELAGAPLEAVILATARDAKRQNVFNNAAQVWNHEFFWNCMAQPGGGEPAGDLARQLDAAFGGFEKFREVFAAAAVSRFGSGWVWLALADGRLAVTSTGNAEMPLVEGHAALLTCDVWEHAYYLDHRNRRADYVASFLANLVDWRFVADRLARAKTRKDTARAVANRKIA